jgi:hypothetical protein
MSQMLETTPTEIALGNIASRVSNYVYFKFSAVFILKKAAVVSLQMNDKPPQLQR